jgi:prophage regulatory protein
LIIWEPGVLLNSTKYVVRQARANHRSSAHRHTITAVSGEIVMQVLRLPAVKAKTGKGHSSIYEDMREGTFPRPVPLGGNAVGWIEEEIDEWIRGRIEQREAAAQARPDDRELPDQKRE